MVELFEVFQQPKFQSLCHDLLFHCRFLFVFCFRYLKQTVILIIHSFCYVLQHGQFLRLRHRDIPRTK